MNPKILTESGWKATAEKGKIKDNGLQRALSAYEKLDDDEHDDRLKGIASLRQLAGTLKKSKEVAAVPAVGEYLADLISAAESEQREITKAKLLAEKSEALAECEAVLVTIINDCGENIYLTIYDLSTGSNAKIFDGEELKKGERLTLKIGTAGKPCLGKIKWIVVDELKPNHANSKIVKDIKSGATIKVHYERTLA